MEAFKIDELLLIENLTYISDIKPLISIVNQDGKTVKEYLDTIPLNEIIDDKDYASYMTGYDFKNLILAMKKSEVIKNLLIKATHVDEAFGGGGGISCVLLDENKKQAVVVFRGTSDAEWTDDFIGANKVDTYQQVNALEWYKQMLNEYHLDEYYITVVGHSKGGNKAKYITILDKSVDRCFSIDGQGFSDKFFEHYKKEILERKDIIENHNIDFDYVNLLMNDIGRKTYYEGYEYGKGGFAEAHCPNTFFHFTSPGVYEIHVNPNGQRPEMQILDQFINSMIRSAINDKERSENNQLVGALVEKAFTLDPTNLNLSDYVSYLCDMVGDPQYVDNAAYLLSFCIIYIKKNPNFLQALRDIMTYFKSENILDILDMIEDLVTSKKLNSLLNLSNFLILHVSNVVVKYVQSFVRKKYNVELTKDQIIKVLQIVSLTKNMLKSLELNMDGSDIAVEEVINDTPEKLPENLNIVVLARGLSNERNISLNTGVKVAEILKEKGHKVILLDAFMGYLKNEIIIENAFENPDTYSLEIDTIPTGIPDLWAVKKRRADQSSAFFGPNVLQICKQSDLVFIALHGANGENGKVQAAFDLLGIDYTGCDYFSSAISSNKTVSKELLANAGIPVPNGFLVKKSEKITYPKDHNISYPVIVKPNNGGIGLGISTCMDDTAYIKALQEAFKWENDIIVEEYIVGREFAVGTLNLKALPVLEVLPLNASEKTGLTPDGKKSQKCPANIPSKLSNSLMKTASLASKVLGLNSYSKVDFIVKPDGSYVCLECDSLPQLNPNSHLIIEAKEAGIDFIEFCEAVVKASLNN